MGGYCGGGRGEELGRLRVLKDVTASYKCLIRNGKVHAFLKFLKPKKTGVGSVRGGGGVSGERVGLL